jgi:hypothetical protein
MDQFYNLEVITLERNYWMKKPYQLLHAFHIQLGQGTRGKISSSKHSLLFYLLHMFTDWIALLRQVNETNIFSKAEPLLPRQLRVACKSYLCGT